jgi:aromatic ring-cleaving dioxygenase
LLYLLLPPSQPRHQPLQPQPHLHQQRQKLSLPKANLLRKTHLKQTQKPLLQPLSKLDLEDSDFIVDDEVTFGRNRKAGEFGKLIHEDELSDHVKFRLWLARQLALKKYQETWG